MAKIWFNLRRTFSALFALIALIGGTFAGTPGVTEGNIKLENEFSYDLSDGICMGQGIAADENYFYCTGAIKVLSYNAIVKIDRKTGERAAINEMCIPKDLMLKGYSHLGDCEIDNGKLYIACEDSFFSHPAIFVYDANSLEFLEWHAVPDELIDDGRIPWVEVNNGILYFSPFDNVNEIKRLDINDGYKNIGSIKLDMTMHKVQGAEFYNGKLYLSTNNGKYDKPTYVASLDDGHTQVAFIRNMGKINAEAEGIAICEYENGTVFHYVDVDTSLHIRSYSLTN